MRSSFIPATRRSILGSAVSLFAGCASSPGSLSSSQEIEVAFSSDANAKTLVLKVIDGAVNLTKFCDPIFNNATES